MLWRFPCPILPLGKGLPKDTPSPLESPSKMEEEDIPKLDLPLKADGKEEAGHGQETLQLRLPDIISRRRKTARRKFGPLATAPIVQLLNQIICKASPRVRPVNSEKPAHRVYRDAMQDTIDTPAIPSRPVQKIRVNKRSLATFTILLPELSNKLLWEDTKKAMGDAGFAVMPAKGEDCRWIFIPKPELGLKNISVHASHEAEIRRQTVLDMRKHI
ncbi:uncharacterized protein PAC_16971 [Phialocephala subalpina]|uniref:Uncharacterized protein n=1 Tax=Phialocephala subalpina TaxID=576137 RepID=A0A1L7XPU7_9HELO|nr:uncharacterized protein PAC_16971 [Phialocephala subalpina]